MGGPLVKDRAVPRADRAVPLQHRRCAEPARRRAAHDEGLSSFTRVDANSAPKHFAGRHRRDLSEHAPTSPTLGTFTPPGGRRWTCACLGKQVALTERALWTNRLLARRRSRCADHGPTSMPQGTAPMELQPETTLGNFFNRQHRATGTYQVVQVVSGSPGRLRRLCICSRRASICCTASTTGTSAEPAGADRARRRHARAPPRLLRRRRAIDRQHRRRRCSRRIVFSRTRAGRRDRRAGSIATASSDTVQPHAAHRRRGAAQRVGQRRAARRVRDCSSSGRRRRRVRSPVRERGRYAVRHRRRHAVSPAVPVTHHGGAGPRDAGRPDVGRRPTTIAGTRAGRFTSACSTEKAATNRS